MTTQTAHNHFADEITPDGAKHPLRVTLTNPDRIVTIRNRKVRVGDIPLSIYSLECGHKGKGIAVSPGYMIFCDECRDIKKVLESRG